MYEGDGLNLYAYCKNNPVVYYDPSGYSQTKGEHETPNEEESEAYDPSDAYAYQRYKESLIKGDVLENSREIITGDKFGDSRLIKELTKNGSSISNWLKMESLYSYTNEYGMGKIHYYKNIKTGEVSYYDAKMKISAPKDIRENLMIKTTDKDGFWIIDLNENLIPKGVRK